MALFWLWSQAERLPIWRRLSLKRHRAELDAPFVVQGLRGASCRSF